MTRHDERDLRNLKTNQGIISYHLIRSQKRRTVAIHIDQQAQVRVLAPRFVDEDKITAFISEKTGWVWRTIHKMRRKRILSVRHEFTAGEEFLFLGKNYPLRIDMNGCGEIKLLFDGAQWHAVVPTLLAAEKRYKGIKEAMIQWYRQQAMEILGGRVFNYSRLMGLEPLKITVKTQKTLWGSCHHQRKSIHLNWKIIMAPMAVIDYVVVHELSHLKVPNHSLRFWREVEKVLPDYKVRKRWLKDNTYKMNFE